MQIDFHHAVTYVLSRLAGFVHPDAVIIAYAAQYVDDAQNRGTIHFVDGRSYDHIASSHEVLDPKNLVPQEDYEVWVPFHFLPGNAGEPRGLGLEVPLERRLTCLPDSPLATDMLKAAIATRGQLGSLHRLGITTHVYADTWAHQRFSGERHHINHALDETHEGFEERAKTTGIANAVGLGHGAVSVHPDQPFRIWKYINWQGVPVPRPNPDIFLHACERIFEFHLAYRGEGGARSLSSADRSVLQASLAGFTSEDENDRHRRWLDLVHSGAFSFGALTDAERQDLEYIPKGVGSWKYAALGTTAKIDTGDEQYVYQESFETSNWKLFHDALKAHQAQVLREIMPAYGLPPSAEALAAMRAAKTN